MNALVLHRYNILKFSFGTRDYCFGGSAKTYIYTHFTYLFIYYFGPVALTNKVIWYYGNMLCCFLNRGLERDIIFIVRGDFRKWIPFEWCISQLSCP